MKIPILSYGTEGGEYTDRKKYSSFFRTTGANRDYVKVYVDVIKNIGWKRVATITQDSSTSVEYMAHVEKELTDNGIEVVLTKKIPKKETNETTLDLTINTVSKIFLALFC